MTLHGMARLRAQLALSLRAEGAAWHERQASCAKIQAYTCGALHGQGRVQA